MDLDLQLEYRISENVDHAAADDATQTAPTPVHRYTTSRITGWHFRSDGSTRATATHTHTDICIDGDTSSGGMFSISHTSEEEEEFVLQNQEEIDRLKASFA